MTDVDVMLPEPSGNGDILVLAGDICVAGLLDGGNISEAAAAHRYRVDSFLARACSLFDYVVYVIGNHECYNYVLEDVVPFLRERYAHHDNFCLLDDEAVDFFGIRFIGSTLWSDFHGGDEHSMRACAKGMSDYRLIGTTASQEVFGAKAPASNRVRLLNPADTLARFEESAIFLSDAATDAIESRVPCVVVTHHAPSFRSQTPNRNGSTLSGAFCSDLESLIEMTPSIRLWIHGHTHDTIDYKIGAARVVSHPRGYPHESVFAAFHQSFVYFDLNERGLVVSDHTILPVASDEDRRLAAARGYLERKYATDNAAEATNPPAAEAAPGETPFIHRELWRPNPTASGSGSRSRPILRRQPRL
jgi:hypothetical protein